MTMFHDTWRVISGRAKTLCGQNVNLFNVKLAVHTVTTKL